MMYPRQTSIEAYRAIRDGGLLSEQRFRVYEYLFNYGPMTGNEINEALTDPDCVSPSYHKRLSELKDLGVVRETGERHCKVTGRNAIAWDVTDRLPKPKPARTGIPARDSKPVHPTAADLSEAARIIGHWRNLAILRGEPGSESLDRVLAWISGDMRRE